MKWIGIGAVVVFVLLQAVPYGWSHSNPPVTANAPWPSPQAESLARRRVLRLPQQRDGVAHLLVRGADVVAGAPRRGKRPRRAELLRRGIATVTPTMRRTRSRTARCRRAATRSSIPTRATERRGGGRADRGARDDARREVTSMNDSERLMRLIDGFVPTQLLYVAAKLGIADALANGPKSVDRARGIGRCRSGRPPPSAARSRRRGGLR